MPARSITEASLFWRHIRQGRHKSGCRIKWRDKRQASYDVVFPLSDSSATPTFARMAADLPLPIANDLFFGRLKTPVLIGQASSHFGPLRMKPAVINTSTTLAKGISKPTDKVSEKARVGLSKVYLAENFLERLIAYIDPAYPHDLPADVRAPYRYTELPGRTLDLPPTDEFIHAIVDLRRAEMAIRENTPSPLLNSRSVQDAAGGQMFPALNSIIRVRFIYAACCDLVV